MGRLGANNNNLGTWICVGLVFTVGLLIALVVLVAVVVGKANNMGGGCHHLQYAAPFACGSNPDSLLRLRPGNYTTMVHIFNPNNHPVTFRKKVALTFPPAEQKAGAVSEWLEDTLGECEALMVDCGEIEARGNGTFDMRVRKPYRAGFVVAQSKAPLEVWAHESSDGSTSVPRRQRSSNEKREYQPEPVTDDESPSIAVYRTTERCLHH
ncbi:hypothetical protein LCGC14_1914800 [marine sediment metagenome]|uniref:Uncharacterized protein n=1 Tax=marine sediment metagenome TaxID=412755 RepID=A0A0F9IQI4_9ZZZZ